MLVLTMRVMIAAGATAVAIVGSTKWCKISIRPPSPRMLTIPVAGKILQFREKNKTRIKPNQNGGVLPSIKVHDIPNLSNTEKGFAAAKIPTKNPINKANKRLGTARMTVLIKRGIIKSNTGRLVEMETPKLPFRTSLSHFRY